MSNIVKIFDGGVTRIVNVTNGTSKVIRVIESGPRGPQGPVGPTGTSANIPFIEYANLNFYTTSSIAFKKDISSSLLPFTGSSIVSSYYLGDQSHVWKSLHLGTGSIYFYDSSGLVSTLKIKQTVGVLLTGSFSGSFKGDGSQLTGITATLPSGLLSSSVQIASDISGSFVQLSSSFDSRLNVFEGKELISSSAQIDHNSTLNYDANRHFLQSEITQVGTVTSGDVSKILPSGVISSSLQFNSVTLPFTGSFKGDGSQLTGVVTGGRYWSSSIDGIYYDQGNVSISGSFYLSGSQSIFGSMYLLGNEAGVDINRLGNAGYVRYGYSGNGGQVRARVNGGLDISNYDGSIVWASVTTSSLEINSAVLISSSMYSFSNVVSNVGGVTVIGAVPSSSYDGIFCEYVVMSGSNSRAGIFMGVWDNSGNINYTDNSTGDIGNTQQVEFKLENTASFIYLKGVVPSSNWRIKGIIRGL